MSLYKNRKILYLFFILSLIPHISFASAWTKNKNEGLLVLDTIHTASKFKYLFKNLEYEPKSFRKREIKLYGEYGIVENLTLGGYVKNYSFKTVEKDSNGNILSDKIKNDKFGNVFFIKNLSRNKNKTRAVSVQTAYYFPIEYEKDVTERLNYLETREALELKLLFGMANSEVTSIPFSIQNGYFLNIEGGIKYLFDSFYNEIVLETTLALKKNQSSMLLFKHELNYDYYKNKEFKKVNKQDSAQYGELVLGLRRKDNYYLSESYNKFSISSIVYFKENFFIETGLFKSFSNRYDTEGFNIALWFKI